MFTDSHGVDLIFKLNVALTSATGATVMIKPPKSGHRDRPGTEKTAVITDAAAGIVTYRTAAGDFPNTGVYRMQVIIYTGTARKLRSDVVDLDVEEALN